jgi:uncharacterized protein YegP (UPF0339 family)
MTFKIKRAFGEGQFYFVIVAKNHKVIATSELYKRKKGMEKAIKVIDPENKAVRIDETIYK